MLYYELLNVRAEEEASHDLGRFTAWLCTEKKQNTVHEEIYGSSLTILKNLFQRFSNHFLISDVFKSLPGTIAEKASNCLVINKKEISWLRTLKAFTQFVWVVTNPRNCFVLHLSCL